MELFELTTGVTPHSNKPLNPPKPARGQISFNEDPRKQTPTCDRDRHVTTAHIGRAPPMYGFLYFRLVNHGTGRKK